MYIDLTHTLKNNITVYPGTTKPSFEQVSNIEKDGFAEMDMMINSHLGTHIDAPAHILLGAKTLEEFPIDKFIGAGLALDCTELNSITLDFLKPHEATIKKVDFILFYTGWQDKWNTPNYFDEFPTLTQEATKWLVTFSLKAVGFDVISVDKMTDEALLNHHILLEKEILIIENMTNLDKLISKEFELNCIPLKIENSDASPVRAFARIKK